MQLEISRRRRERRSAPKRGAERRLKFLCRKRAGYKARGFSSNALELYERFDMIRLREDIVQSYITDFIARAGRSRSGESGEIARESCGITRKIGDVRRAQIAKPLDCGWRKSGARRIEHDEIGRFFVADE